MYKEIPNLRKAKAMDNFSIYLVFADGIEGVVDLNDVERDGLFTIWNNHFKDFKIDGNRLIWSEMLDIDSDSLYLKLINKDFFEYARN